MNSDNDGGLLDGRLLLLEALAGHGEFREVFLSEAQHVLDAIKAVPDMAAQFGYVLHLRALIDQQTLFLAAARERAMIEAGREEPDDNVRILQ